MGGALMPRKNSTGGFPPPWWVTHGSKMKVAKIDAHSLSIKGSAAVLVITALGNTAYYDWILQWNITHGWGSVQGSVNFEHKDLALAFGLADGFGSGAGALIEMGYNADAAAQGQYIRVEKYLNIPHPGTSLHGDPNISIFVSNEIQEAVRRLFAEHKTAAA